MNTVSKLARVCAVIILVMLVVMLVTAVTYAAGVDLSAPSGLTAEDLSLLHELEGYEQTFIDAEAEHGVRADFLAAIAALESGWGRYQFMPNNIMGFGDRSFESFEDCIDYVAAWLSEHYLDPDGIYYSGNTVRDVCVYYNGADIWSDCVIRLMGEINPNTCPTCGNIMNTREELPKGELWNG